MSQDNETAVFIDNDQRQAVLTAVFDAYNHREHATKVGLDTNRLWCSKRPTLADLPIPNLYRWRPDTVRSGSAYNIAQLYAKPAKGIRADTPVSPGFDAAVTRHRQIDAIQRASDTGQKQIF